MKWIVHTAEVYLLPGTFYPPTGDVVPVNPIPQLRIPATVTLGGAALESLFTGPSPGFMGLGQMNPRLPATLPAGSPSALKIQSGAAPAVTVQLAVE